MRQILIDSHVAMPIESLDSREKLVVVPDVDKHLRVVLHTLLTGNVQQAQHRLAMMSASAMARAFLIYDNALAEARCTGMASFLGKTPVPHPKCLFRGTVKVSKIVASATDSWQFC